MSAKKASNWSVQTSIAIFFAVFAITITTSYILTGFYFNNIEKNQIILRKAEENIYILQQILVYANQVAKKQETSKTFLAESISRYQVNLDLMRDGGVVIIENEPIELPPCDEEAKVVLQELEKAWNEYKTQASLIVAKQTLIDDLTAEDKEGKGNTLMLNPEVRAALDYLENNIDVVTLLNNQLTDRFFSLTKDQKTTSNYLLGVLLVVNVSLIIIGFLLIRFWLFLPINRIGKVVKAVATGNLHTKVAVIQNNELGLVAHALNDLIDRISHATDFIKGIEQGNLYISYAHSEDETHTTDSLADALLNMQKRLVKVAQEEAERTWATRGQALFAEILQKSYQDIETLAYEIIANLVQYIEANQGGLFMANDNTEEVELSLIACYAFGRRKYIYQKIRPNEGLVGQVFKDTTPIYITDIPDNYTTITSGLGGAKPKSIYILPLKLAEQVLGVIEIASFDLLPTYKIDFIEKLSENIASNLYAAKASQQTQKLLQESKMTAEQMLMQERIMMQNLEYLQSSQEQMQLEKDEIEALRNAISHAMLTAEYDMSRKILGINAPYLQILGYEAEDVLGKEHRIFISKKQQDTRSFIKLWEALRMGNQVTGEYKRITKTNQDVWIKAIYTPVINRYGRVEKILEFAFDITDEKEKLLELEEKLGSILRTGYALEINMQGHILDVSEPLLKLLDYTLTDLQGKPYEILIPEFEHEGEQSPNLVKGILSGLYAPKEVCLLSKGKKEFWFKPNFTPIFDLQGKPYKIFELLTDINEIRGIERKALKAQRDADIKEANLNALLNNTDNIIYSVDANYKISLFNEATQKFYNQLAYNIYYGFNILDITDEDSFYSRKTLYDRALGGEKFTVEEEIVSPKNQAKFLLNSAYSPVKDDNQVVIGVVVFSQDITQKVQKDYEDSITQKLVAQYKSQNQELTQMLMILEEEKDRLQSQIIGIKQQFENPTAQELYAMLGQTQEVIFTIDKHFHIKHYNQTTFNIFKEWRYSLQLDYLLLDLFPIQRFYTWKKAIEQVMKTNTPVHLQEKFLNRKQGYAHTFLVSIYPVHQPKGEEPYYLVCAKNITNYYNLRQKKQTFHFTPLPSAVGNALQKNIDWQNDHDLVVLNINDEFRLNSYNNYAQQTFRQWHLYLQPQYDIRDTFPMKRFYDRESIIIRAFNGEHITIEEVFVNKYKKTTQIFAIRVEAQRDSQNEVKEVILKAKDITAWRLPELYQQKKQNRKSKSN